MNLNDNYLIDDCWFISRALINSRNHSIYCPDERNGEKKGTYYLFILRSVTLSKWSMKFSQQRTKSCSSM